MILILRTFLDDTFEFSDRFTYKDLEDVVKEIRSIVKEFKPENDGTVTLAEFSDLCIYFLKRTRGRKFIRFTRMKDYEFHAFLEKAIEVESEQFKGYMLYLNKNLLAVTINDFVKILTRFKILNMPIGKDLDLNPTSSK